jgi:hypothetical protein
MHGVNGNQTYFFIQLAQTIAPLKSSNSFSDDDCLFDIDIEESQVQLEETKNSQCLDASDWGFEVSDDNELNDKFDLLRRNDALPLENSVQDEKEKIVTAFGRELPKIFEILQGKVENYEIDGLGKGSVYLIGTPDQKNKAIRLSEKIKRTIYGEKVVLALLEVNQNNDENQIDLKFKIACESNSKGSIENIKQMIAMNIMTVKLHKDKEKGLGSFKAVWKRELPA